MSIESLMPSSHLILCRLLLLLPPIPPSISVFPLPPGQLPWSLLPAFTPPCHGVARLEAVSWLSMDAGHMQGPWAAAGPHGDLDSH